MVEGKPTARLDEAGIALWDRHRDPGPHEHSSTPSWNYGIVMRVEIATGVAGVGI